MRGVHAAREGWGNLNDEFWLLFCQDSVALNELALLEDQDIASEEFRAADDCGSAVSDDSALLIVISIPILDVVLVGNYFLVILLPQVGLVD